jgi:hypothetical protein
MNGSGRGGSVPIVKLIWSLLACHDMHQVERRTAHISAVEHVLFQRVSPRHSWLRSSLERFVI